MSRFKPIKRDMNYLFPPSMNDWLPERHLARDAVAFRFVAADEHPDHDTLNTFRKRFLKDIEVLMVQVLMIAHTMKVSNFGNIAFDGSKFRANASRHSALSYGHIKKLEEQLKGEVKKLMELAEAADNEKIRDGKNPQKRV